MSGEHARRLRDLVQECHEHYSYREMADRAQRAGRSISHSQLADYAADSVAKTPSGDQILALAAALDLGVEAVYAAVFEQYYGYVPRGMRHGTRAAKIAGALPSDLDPEEEAELLRMIEAWLTARRRQS